MEQRARGFRHIRGAQAELVEEFPGGAGLAEHIPHADPPQGRRVAGLGHDRGDGVAQAADSNPGGPYESPD